MAVFRIEKNHGYTVMSNHHLRNKELSLKAKGLLSQMLSLPDDWDYTLAGLSHINKESIDAIRTAIWELERAGYIIRQQGRDAKGKMTAIEYTIFEKPQLPQSILENPIPDNPTSENPTQLNKDISSNYQQKKDLSITDESNPILSNPPTPMGTRMGWNPEKYTVKSFWRISTMKFLRQIRRWTVNSWTRSRRSSLIQFALPGNRFAFPVTTSRRRWSSPGS